MRQRALQALLLIHAIEQTDLAGDALSLDDRAQASREAADGRPLPAVAERAADQRRLGTLSRAPRGRLLARLRVRSPGVDRVLAAGAGATSLDRTILLLGFILGVAIAFADGGRIHIFAYPLIGLLLWNLIVYVILIVRTVRSPGQAGLAQTPRRSPDRADPARWILPPLARQALWQPCACAHRGSDHSLDRLQRAARTRPAALCGRLVELGRPLFRERVAPPPASVGILAAVGLMVGYDLRGWLLRQAAGWSTTVFGPASAHTALVTLYGAASAVSGVPIPSAHDSRRSRGRVLPLAVGRQGRGCI